jgi:CheY-like chemotaxis protein
VQGCNEVPERFRAGWLSPGPVVHWLRIAGRSIADDFRTIWERMDTKKTIMVVDDNPDIITIVKTILEGRGFTVFSASSGHELLNMLPSQKPDLLILDIMMPEMDGLEVLTRLKGKTETSTIPVILLTAKVQYEDVLGGYKLGADYYITKPFTSTQLVNGINLLLGEGKAAAS